MPPESRRLAGILLIVLPTVVYRGLSILSLMLSDPKYMANPLRQDFWRAGDAHAAVLIMLSLTWVYQDKRWQCVLHTESQIEAKPASN